MVVSRSEVRSKSRRERAQQLPRLASLMLGPPVFVFAAGPVSRYEFTTHKKLCICMYGREGELAKTGTQFSLFIASGHQFIPLSRGLGQGSLIHLLALQRHLAHTVLSTLGSLNGGSRL